MYANYKRKELSYKRQFFKYCTTKNTRSKCSPNKPILANPILALRNLVYKKDSIIK